LVSLSHKYTSQELDTETGLYYYNARYYNPVLGKFISADTIVASLKNPQALNRYSYVLNNPLRYTDPTGHRFSDTIDKILHKMIASVVSQVSAATNIQSRLASAVSQEMYAAAQFQRNAGRWLEDHSVKEYKENRDTINAYQYHVGIDPIVGGYQLKKTEKGSNILAYEIVGAATVGCIGWGLTCSTASQGFLAGYEAYRKDGNILSAVVKGAEKGAILDAVGYYIKSWGWDSSYNVNSPVIPVVEKSYTILSPMGLYVGLVQKELGTIIDDIRSSDNENSSNASNTAVNADMNGVEALNVSPQKIEK
jgi:RHS repeat-associated protein